MWWGLIDSSRARLRRPGVLKKKNREGLQGARSRESEQHQTLSWEEGLRGRGPRLTAIPGIASNIVGYLAGGG